MSDERTQRAEEALNAVLKPLGTNLKHYMAVHRDEAIEAMAKALNDERNAQFSECRAEMERLRWRHPHVIPDWNDLPQDKRIALVKLARDFFDEVHGGDFVVNFYAELRKELALEKVA